MAQVEVTKSVPSLPPTDLKPEPEVKPKRTRKRKAKTVEQPSGLTQDEVRAALELVSKKLGFLDAKKLLTGFKIAKLSLLPTEKYKEFVDACLDALPDD